MRRIRTDHMQRRAISWVKAQRLMPLWFYLAAAIAVVGLTLLFLLVNWYFEGMPLFQEHYQ